MATAVPTSAAPIHRVLAAALVDRAVVVTLKNGVVVRGTVAEFEAESGTVVVDTTTAAASVGSANGMPSIPPHLLCVPRVTLRGSAVAFIDFPAAAGNLDLIARAALAA